jgi:hypothetical protein
MGKNNKCLTNSAGKSESNRVNVKPRFKWKNGIKTDFKQDGMNWTELAQDMDHQWLAPVRTNMTFRV